MVSWSRGLIQKRMVRILMPIYETNRLVIFLYKKPAFYGRLQRMLSGKPLKAPILAKHLSGRNSSSGI